MRSARYHAGVLVRVMQEEDATDQEVFDSTDPENGKPRRDRFAPWDPWLVMARPSTWQNGAPAEVVAEVTAMLGDRAAWIAWATILPDLIADLNVRPEQAAQPALALADSLVATEAPAAHRAWGDIRRKLGKILVCSR